METKQYSSENNKDKVKYRESVKTFIEKNNENFIAEIMSSVTFEWLNIFLSGKRTLEISDKKIEKLINEWMTISNFEEVMRRCMEQSLIASQGGALIADIAYNPISNKTLKKERTPNWLAFSTGVVLLSESNWGILQSLTVNKRIIEINGSPFYFIERIDNENIHNFWSDSLKTNDDGNFTIFKETDKNMKITKKLLKASNSKSLSETKKNPWGFVNAVLIRYGSNNETLFSSSQLWLESIKRSFENMFWEQVNNRTYITFNEKFFKTGSLEIIMNHFTLNPHVKFNTIAEGRKNTTGTSSLSQLDMVPLLRFEPSNNTIAFYRDDVDKSIAYLKKIVGIVDSSGGGGNNKQNVEGSLMAVPMIANFSHLSKKWENKINFLILKMIIVAQEQDIIDSKNSEKEMKLSIDDINFQFNSISDVEQTISNEEGVIDTKAKEGEKQNENPSKRSD